MMMLGIAKGTVVDEKVWPFPHLTSLFKCHTLNCCIQSSYVIFTLWLL